MTLPTIAERIRCKPSELAPIMREEMQRGRVSRNAAGAYALIAEAFESDTLRALREIG